MASFVASPLTSPAPTVQYNLPGDLQAAQGIQQGQNALTMQAQQVSDMQQAVALRPGLAAGDPQALNALSVIDPAGAQAQRQAQFANATMPLQIAQARVGYLSKVATGILATPEAQRPAAYAFALSQMSPEMASTLPPQYPGDGAIQQTAFAGGNLSDAVKYMQTAIQPGGGAPAAAGGASPPTTYAGAVGGAESGNNPTATSPTSSAAGPDQFINSTWLDEMKTHRPDLTNGLSDQQILAMRTAPPANDPGPSSEMTNDYAQDNTPELQQHSIPITPVSLYAAHHFGPGGAVDLYAAEAKDPTTPVTSIFPPAVIQANPGLAGQTVGGLMGTLRQQMANVPAGTFGNPLVRAAAPAAGGLPVQPASYMPGTPSAGAPAASTPPAYVPNPAAPGTTYQPAVGPAASSGIPAGITPFYHGDGTPADAPNQPGYQLGRNASGQVVPFPMPGGTADPATLAVNAHINAAAGAGFQLQRDPNTGAMVYQPIPGGPADPAVIAQRAAATASAAGPLAGGPNATPPQQVGAGPFPLPPTNPYAGMANNKALADQMAADKGAAAKVVADDAPLLAKDIRNVQLATQFQRINAGTPTGSRAASDAATWARTNLPFTPSNAPYQTMGKISNELKVAALPSGMGRLDLPIIQAVAKQQPSIENLRAVNTNITNVQIAAAQRDIDYRTARAQYVQQFGHLQGFDGMWNDYNNHVPMMLLDRTGMNALPNTAAPPFTQWVQARAPGGTYNPSLANVPDSQLPGAQPSQLSQSPAYTPVIDVGGSRGAPMGQPGSQYAPQPQTQRAAASPPPAANANTPGPVQQQQASMAIGQTATGPNGLKMRWDGQQWDATGGGH
jgi:hypothetical protein